MLFDERHSIDSLHRHCDRAVAVSLGSRRSLSQHIAQMYHTLSLMRLLFVLLALIPSFTISVCESRAELLVLGPKPYLTRADSPFPVQASSAGFFLEDFEDGQLNTPGIFQPFLPITHAVVLSPSELTDSVDEDDGVVDGSGLGGHSLAARLSLIVPTDPPFSWSFIQFGFGRDAFGQYPNAFGFVWTDGVSPSDLLAEFLDQDPRLFDQYELFGLGDGLLTGHGQRTLTLTASAH
jgi:hypothetical protein